MMRIDSTMIRDALFKNVTLFTGITNQDLINTGWNNLFVVTHVLVAGVVAGFVNLTGQDLTKNLKDNYFVSCASRGVACAAGISATLLLNDSTRAMFFTADKAFKIFIALCGASSLLSVITNSEDVLMMSYAATFIGVGGALTGYFGQNTLAIIGTITAIGTVYLIDDPSPSKGKKGGKIN